MRNCQYDTAISGEAMNEVYELLKTMTADQIRRAAERSRPEEHPFWQQIQLLRIRAFEFYERGDRARAAGIHEAIDAIVESWRLGERS